MDRLLLPTLHATSLHRPFIAVQVAHQAAMTLLLCVLALFTAPRALAQGAAVTPDAIRAFALREAQRQATELHGARFDITVGAIDARLSQAPCAGLTYALGGNGRAWGRTSVTARCTDGSAWSVLVPVTVRVFGPALVAARPLPALQAVTSDDVRVSEVELSREPQGVVTDAAQLDGRVLSRTLGLGQPIPLVALRAPQVIGQGDMVKVVGSGRGFSIGTDGVALAGALDGQPVRVRTESGRVLTGTARSGRVVEVAF